MTHVIGLTDRAQAEWESAFQWWAENRSEAQANKWHNAFADSIKSLRKEPTKFPLSPENGAFPYEIRDLRFGIGRRKTHRAVFTIRPNIVLVIAVRHLAQQNLDPDDF